MLQHGNRCSKGHDNADGVKFCGECGEDLLTNSASLPLPVSYPPQKSQIPDITCPRCGAQNFGNSTRCFACQLDLTRQYSTSPSPNVPNRPRIPQLKSINWKKHWAVITGWLIAIVLLMFMVILPFVVFQSDPNGYDTYLGYVGLAMGILLLVACMARGTRLGNGTLSIAVGSAFVLIGLLYSYNNFTIVGFIDDWFFPVTVFVGWICLSRAIYNIVSDSNNYGK